MLRSPFIRFVAMSALIGSASVSAVPVSDTTLTWVRQLNNVDPSTTDLLVNTTSTTGSLSNTTTSASGTKFSATGNLSTASTKTLVDGASSSPSSTQSLVGLFDTLTFDTPGGTPTTVSYEYSLDGLLANSGTETLNGATGSGSVSIYDITGLTTWIEVDNSEPGDPRYFVEPSLRIDRTGIFFALGSQAFLDLGFAAVADESLADTSGIPQLFDLTKSGSFEADPSKVYGIYIFQDSGVRGPGSSDFNSTGAFRFTELNGATFESGSGQLLAAVPVSPTLALFGIGVADFLGSRRRASQST